ncbi:hypothetical protein [Yeosuana marina]|uniref:hypothetical protein n=1 Tax=Yeosuana marina TaxID=1565536 RepID=UPI001421385A|nr:hypothetical protein [Yeosuana marina]
MKKHLNIFTTIILIFFLASCSTEEIGQNNDIVGVWQRVDYNDNTGYQLVFKADNTGIRIYTEVEEDKIISSANSFNWQTIDNTVTLLQGDISLVSYIINSEKQLVLSLEDNLPFNKVSNNTSTY